MKNQANFKTKSVLTTSLIFLFMTAPAQEKSKFLGNKSNSKSTNCSIVTKKGIEIGTIIKTGGKNYALDKLNFTLLNAFPESLALKVKLYSLHKNVPDQNMAETKTIVVLVPKTGNVTIDLSSYTFTVKDDFFISLECMETPPSFNTLFFSSVLLKNGSYLRSAESPSWEKLKMMALGFNLSATAL